MSVAASRTDLSNRPAWQGRRGAQAHPALRFQKNLLLLLLFQELAWPSKIEEMSSPRRCHQKLLSLSDPFVGLCLLVSRSPYFDNLWLCKKKNARPYCGSDKNFRLKGHFTLLVFIWFRIEKKKKSYTHWCGVSMFRRYVQYNQMRWLTEGERKALISPGPRVS